MEYTAIKIFNNGLKIIEELEKLGAKNKNNLTGRAPNGMFYYITEEGIIKSTWNPETHWFLKDKEIHYSLNNYLNRIIPKKEQIHNFLIFN